MTRMIQGAGLVLGTSIIAIALSPIGTKTAAAAVAAAVQVVNTSANPVPVTGNVGLTSGASVKVLNGPNALLIQDARASQREYVQGNGSCNWPTSPVSFPFCSASFYIVPADKRLVLTHMSGHASTGTGTLAYAQIAQLGAGTDLAFDLPNEFLAASPIDRDFNGNHFYAFNHEVVVVFGPNQTAAVLMTASAPSPGSVFRFMYSGYLEPAN
jgi:hypothetical protein